jgi:DNA-binding response OmpR family regulator
MRQYQLLVVEDNQALARTIASILEEELDCTVVLTYDGGTALHTLASASFDLMLLDIALPDLDGLWLAQRLQADRTHRDMPLLIVTGTEPWPVLARLQVAHYLPKPFDFGDLLSQVRLLLGLPPGCREPPSAE